jgi:hypothetical protein
VVGLLAVASWDVLGLLIGDAAYRSPSYDVLRIPAAGGVRPWGVILAVLVLAVLVELRLFTAGGTGRRLRWALAWLSVWWLVWAAGVVLAWIYHRQVLSWGGPPKLLFLSVLALACARAVPRVPPSDRG